MTLCCYRIKSKKNYYLIKINQLYLFYSCDYNKYTLSVVKRIATLQISNVKEEIKTENDPMEVDDENDVIAVL